jgi:tol-pal system protein YbgF
MLRHISIAAMGALLLTSAAAVPVTAQSREERAHMQLAADLRILLQQQQELALAVASLTQSLADTGKALNGRLDALDNSLRKLIADQGLTIGEIATNVRGIDQRSRESITRLGELKEEVDALRKAVVALAQRPTTFAPVDPLDPNAPPSPSPDVSQAPLPDPPATSALGISSRRLLDAGFADFASGNFSSAIRYWEELLKTYPDSEFADDAQLNIGDAEFQQNRFEQAVAAYNLVIQRYPNGNQVPAAYYKLGVAHERLQRYDSARAAWQQLLKQHPNSAEAGLATQSLRRIERSQGTQKP